MLINSKMNLIKELKEFGISKQTLDIIDLIPREKFMLEKYKKFAYINSPFEIDCKQTILQPMLQAFMIDRMKIESTDNILEIGTGSGYNLACLSSLCRSVTSTEILEQLCTIAKDRLEMLTIYNFNIILCDGLKYKYNDLFDKIVITGGLKSIPHNLIKILKTGGRMILILELGHSSELSKYGDSGIFLFIIKKVNKHSFRVRKLMPVASPMLLTF